MTINTSCSVKSPPQLHQRLSMAVCRVWKWLKTPTPLDRSQDQLFMRRVKRAKDSKDVLPGDLLRTMANDIETGQLPCDGLVLVAIHRPKEKAWEQNTYRYNMSYDQELVALELAKDRCMRKWLNP